MFLLTCKDQELNRSGKSREILVIIKNYMCHPSCSTVIVKREKCRSLLLWSLARNQLMLWDDGYRTNVLCNVSDHQLAYMGTPCTYPQRDGQAELTWSTDYIPRWFTCIKLAGHLTINWAEARITLYVESNSLLLVQAITLVIVWAASWHRSDDLSIAVKVEIVSYLKQALWLELIPVDSQPTGDLVINLAAGCHYLPPNLPSRRASRPFGHYQITLLCDRFTRAQSITWEWNGKELKLQPLDH